MWMKVKSRENTNIYRVTRKRNSIYRAIVSHNITLTMNDEMGRKKANFKILITNLYMGFIFLTTYILG